MMTMTEPSFKSFSTSVCRIPTDFPARQGLTRHSREAAPVLRDRTQQLPRRGLHRRQRSRGGSGQECHRVVRGRAWSNPWMWIVTLASAEVQTTLSVASVTAICLWWPGSNARLDASFALPVSRNGSMTSTERMLKTQIVFWSLERCSPRAIVEL